MGQYVMQKESEIMAKLKFFWQEIWHVLNYPVLYCSLAADAIRKTIKKMISCRKTTNVLNRLGFCGQVQQMVRPIVV
jgi:hypothetical protein